MDMGTGRAGVRSGPGFTARVWGFGARIDNLERRSTACLARLRRAFSLALEGPRMIDGNELFDLTHTTLDRIGWPEHLSAKRVDKKIIFKFGAHSVEDVLPPLVVGPLIYHHLLCWMMARGYRLSLSGPGNFRAMLISLTGEVDKVLTSPPARTAPSSKAL